MKQMGADIVEEVNHATGDYDIVPYQTTHNTGGTIIGASSDTSVVCCRSVYVFT